MLDILVVEDSPTQAEQLRYLLEQNGYMVRVARHGREALELLAAWRPGLIVSDIIMPEMDGYALCRAVKSDPALKDIPVVIVTSLSAIQDIARALECGADNFIRKPYDPKMLLARVHYIRLNQELRRGKHFRIGTELYLEGKKHLITSDREQIVDMLVSTYEEAVHMNEELQERQREIARSSQVLAALYRIADELNAVSSEAEVCERTLSSAMELPKFQAGWILLDDGDAKCRLAAGVNLPDSLRVAAPAGDCTCWREFRCRKGERSSFIVECERMAGEGGGARHASIPLCLDHRRLGLINLVAAPGESFDQDDLKMLDAIGNQVVVALERARLYEHLESLVAQRTAALQAEVAERKQAEERVARLNRIYAVLSGINTMIVRVHDRQKLFQDACRLAVEHGGFGMAWIGLLDHDSFRLKRMAWQVAEGCLAGECANTLAMASEQPPGDTLVEVLHDGRTIVCRDLEVRSDIPLAAEALACGYRSMVGLPLAEGGNPVGILALYASEPDIFD
ncbi:MAG: GAF domain-containing protein, partial [Zoogloea sp.]|nr:GAF domain-containing protein [Zoogloea sp.]